jgi:predicted N-formylglutamate amidohydrolase
VPYECNRMHILITCEHGGNRVPARYRPLFKRHREALESHRGYDPGALAIARDLARAFEAELVYSTTSRLLVELNRSPRHPQIFSEATRGQPPEERQTLLQRYYFPYRRQVEAEVARATRGGERVLHISAHSFTPRLNGIERRADVGLLYDPRRAGERRFCLAWKRALESARPGLLVRRNYPYRGYADGLTTHLRRRFAERSYSGIELEVNQKHALGEPHAWRALRALLVATLRHALTGRF